jgi:hypothetical protein
MAGAIDKAFSSTVSRGISKNESQLVLSHSVLHDGVTKSDVREVKAARKKYDAAFTAPGKLEVDRFIGRGWKGDGSYDSKFSLLYGLYNLERSPGLQAKWGAANKFDPALPTFERVVAPASVPKAIRNAAMAHAITVAKQEVGRSFVPLRLRGTVGIYDLEQRLVGWRIDIARSDDVKLGEWDSVDVWMTKAGTSTGVTSIWNQPILD